MGRYDGQALGEASVEDSPLLPRHVTGTVLGFLGDTCVSALPPPDGPSSCATHSFPVHCLARSRCLEMLLPEQVDGA